MLTRPSSLAAFLRCEHLWFTRHVLQVEVVELPGARSRGTFFHALLDEALRRYADTERVFAYEGDEGEEVCREVAIAQYRDRGVPVDEVVARECLAAIRYHIPLLDLPSWEIVRLPDGRPCIEIELEAKGWPTPEHSIAHRLDLVMRKRATSKTWHIDFKSSKDNLVKPRSTDRDYQLLFSRILLREHGIEVDGSLLYYVRSQAPTPPDVVYKGKKNERLSTAADQPCDWPTYERAIRDRGEDPSDYPGMREKLADKVFAQWCPDITSPSAEREMVRQLVRSLNRMHDLAEGKAVPTRSFGYTCKPGPRSSGCDYNEWCAAGLGKPEGYDLVQLGIRYRAASTSPLAGHSVSNPDPDAAFVEFARRHGRPDHEPLQEFKP